MKKNSFLSRVSNLFKSDISYEEYQSKGEAEGFFCYKDEGRTKEMLNYPSIVSMLENYDVSRIAPIQEAIGYEDARMFNFNFMQLKKYFGHIENLSKKAKIEVTGISFISAVTKDVGRTKHGYKTLIYIPTTNVNGKEIMFDPMQSYKQGRLVTLKEMLGEFGYNWVYDSKEDYTNRGEKLANNTKKKSTEVISNERASMGDFDQSGAGNFGTIAPPY